MEWGERVAATLIINRVLGRVETNIQTHDYASNRSHLGNA
jgi:hypothetical protein